MNYNFECIACENKYIFQMKGYRLLSTEHIKLTNRQHSTEIPFLPLGTRNGQYNQSKNKVVLAGQLWGDICLINWTKRKSYNDSVIMTHPTYGIWDGEKRWAKEIKTKGTLIVPIGMPTVEAINQMCSLDLITITSGSIWNSKQILTFIHGFPFSWAMVELVEMHLSKGNLNRINAS